MWMTEKSEEMLVCIAFVTYSATRILFSVSSFGELSRKNSNKVHTFYYLKPWNPGFGLQKWPKIEKQVPTVPLMF